MANPRLVFLDTDALIQIFISDAISALRNLKSSYGIQAVIVPEVELEICSRKFGARFGGTLRKAVSAETILVLDAPTFTQLLTKYADLQAAAVGVSYAEIQTLGARYNLRADLGESYTFAAAVKLGQPAVSNDYSAVKTMLNAGYALPSRILRAYDIFIFANQIAQFTDRRCDEIRQSLLSEKSEFIPAAFRNASTADGLRNFVPRLVDAQAAPVGRGYKGPDAFDSPILISPL